MTADQQCNSLRKKLSFCFEKLSFWIHEMISVKNNRPNIVGKWKQNILLFQISMKKKWKKCKSAFLVFFLVLFHVDNIYGGFLLHLISSYVLLGRFYRENKTILILCDDCLCCRYCHRLCHLIHIFIHSKLYPFIR